MDRRLGHLLEQAHRRILQIYQVAETPTTLRKRKFNGKRLLMITTPVLPSIVIDASTARWIKV